MRFSRLSQSFALFIVAPLAVQSGCLSSEVRGAATDHPDSGIEEFPIELMPGTASALDCYRSPAGEGAANLIDGDSNTKFVAYGSSVAVHYDAGSPYLASKYAITSANDYPERDPRSWILSASNDGEVWSEIDRRVGEVFTDRLERREFAIGTNSFYRFYRLRMENQTGGVTQVADLELYGQLPFAPTATQAPAAPTSLSATASSRTEINLSWTDIADNETYFRIEQATDGQTFSVLAYAPANVESFSLSGLDAGQAYSFRVIAENAQGDSNPSNLSEAETLPKPLGTATEANAFTYSEDGYSITIIDENTGTPVIFKDGLVSEFFVSYPAMVSAYNSAAVRDIRVTMDSSYDGVAFANFGTGNITISSSWAKTTDPAGPKVLVHEGFHLIQNYGSYNTPSVPGWATEGLADFARWEFYAPHPAGCWVMQRYEPGQNYTDAYRVTARFLLWLRDNVRPSIVQELDTTLRSNQYTEAFWSNATGKSVDELWADYAAVPAHQPVDYP